MRLSGRQITLDLAGQNIRPTGESRSALAAAFDPIVRHLPAEERRLAHEILVSAIPYREAAARIGIPLGSLTRRVQRLRALLSCPTRRAVAANLHTLAPELRQLAVQHFLLGYWVRLLSIQRGVGRSVMQREIDYLKGWARALDRAARQTTPPPDDADDVDDESSGDTPSTRAP